MPRFAISLVTLKFVEHIRATPRHIVVDFSIMFRGGCKFVVEGY